MNVFNQLLKLYKTTGIKSPLEDFTTEILVSILASNQLLLNAFVNKILVIEGKDFTISSQEHFASEEGIQDCRVDIVIRNGNTLCFLENKVHASEGNDQLLRYNKILQGYVPSVITYLRYCTKYNDKKDLAYHDFKQFRWQDIATFLKEWQDVDLVKQYLQFLHTYQMNTDTSFSSIDLVSLENINPLVNKMEAYLQKIKPRFESEFGKSKDVNNLQQIKDKFRFVFVKIAPFGNGWNELGVGFDFTGAASLMVWIWSDSRNDKFSEYKKALHYLDKDKFESNDADWMALTIPLSSFLAAKNIEVVIEEWFFKSFLEIRDFAASTPQLNWNLPG